MIHSKYVKDLVGEKYTRWTVVSYAGVNKNKKSLWNCICDCKTEKIVSGRSLQAGDSKSCGCLMKELTSQRFATHGQTGTKLFEVWRHMIARCTDTDHHAYIDYGGRGITVSDSWMCLENFILDNKLYECTQLTLDRINNELGYSLENTRWVDMKTQCNNRRNNRYITYNGKTTTIAILAEEINMNYQTLYWRIVRKKMSIDDAVNNKVRIYE